jgi:hypothetical protein
MQSMAANVRRRRTNFYESAGHRSAYIDPDRLNKIKRRYAP